MAKNKRPKAKFQPHLDKTPKTSGRVPPFDGHPSWRFRRLEFDGPWSWRKMTLSDFNRVLEKLSNFETMNWADILGARNHSIPVESLCKRAQDRLQEIRLDDVDEVLSLAITGQERVIGWRIDGVVFLLWWDPKHEVCPSTKGNT